MSTNVRRRAGAGAKVDNDEEKPIVASMNNPAAVALSRGGIMRQTNILMALFVRLMLTLVICGLLYGFTHVTRHAGLQKDTPTPLPTLAELRAIVAEWEKNNSSEKVLFDGKTPKGPIPHRLWLPDCELTRVSTGFTSNTPLIDCKANVKNTIDKHHAVWMQNRQQPGQQQATSYPEVKYLTDGECLLLIELAKKELLLPFRVEYNNDFKYDICRISALFLYGGYYLDVELEVMEPVILKDPDVSFITAVEASHKGFFEAFVACTPKHPILKLTLDKMAEYYKQAYVSPSDYSSLGFDDANTTKRNRNTLPDDQDDEYPKTSLDEENLGYIDSMVQQGLVDEDPSWKLGPRTLKDAYVALTPAARGKTMLLQEINLDPSDQYGHWYPKVIRRRDLPNQQCCCNYIVHDPRTETAHFYSRTKNTLYC